MASARLRAWYLRFAALRSSRAWTAAHSFEQVMMRGFIWMRMGGMSLPQFSMMQVFMVDMIPQHYNIQLPWFSGRVVLTMRYYPDTMLCMDGNRYERIARMAGFDTGKIIQTSTRPNSRQSRIFERLDKHAGQDLDSKIHRRVFERNPEAFARSTLNVEITGTRDLLGDELVNWFCLGMAEFLNEFVDENRGRIPMNRSGRSIINDEIERIFNDLMFTLPFQLGRAEDVHCHTAWADKDMDLGIVFMPTKKKEG